jgi:DNA repair ATPase RecN
MKKTLLLLVLIALALHSRLFAQSQEAQQLLLNVEKLAQLKQLLTDMKKGYQILSSGYSTIKDVSQGNFSLHRAYLDGLLQVSPTVRKYRKVAEIINYQVMLVKEYKHAYSRFRQDGNFDPQELGYLGRVYANLFKQSLNNLDALTTVMTANQLRMSDDERLQAIDYIFQDMQDKLLFLRHFNANTTILAVQRAREKNDVSAIRKIYGIAD